MNWEVVHDGHLMSPSQLERLFQEMVLCAEAVTSKDIHKTLVIHQFFCLRNVPGNFAGFQLMKRMIKWQVHNP